MLLTILQPPTTTDASTCAKCGGECCKSMPGLFHPSDFPSDPTQMRTTIRALLQTGNYAIDWWEGDPRPDTAELSQVYYIRPRTIRDHNPIRNASWGGTCVFLTPDGCSLTFPDRPAECRALVPNPLKFSNPFERCGMPDLRFSKQQSCIAWVEFQPILISILDELDP